MVSFLCRFKVVSFFVLNCTFCFSLVPSLLSQTTFYLPCVIFQSREVLFQDFKIHIITVTGSLGQRIFTEEKKLCGSADRMKVELLNLHSSLCPQAKCMVVFNPFHYLELQIIKYFFLCCY